jgi:hypothetical protein
MRRWQRPVNDRPLSLITWRGTTWARMASSMQRQASLVVARRHASASIA